MLLSSLADGDEHADDDGHDDSDDDDEGEDTFSLFSHEASRTATELHS